MSAPDQLVRQMIGREIRKALLEQGLTLGQMKDQE